MNALAPPTIDTLPTPEEMARRLGLHDEVAIAQRLRVHELAPETDDPCRYVRGLIKRKRTSHFRAGQRVYLSTAQLIEFDKRCTWIGSRPAFTLPEARICKLADEYERKVLARRRLARNWAQKQLAGNPTYRLNARIRKAVHGSLKGLKRGRSWVDLTGYTLADLRAHLAALFVDGMSWENYGDWHVDHIRPLSSFAITGPDCPEFRAAWALTNLQPLWARDNLVKGSRWKPE